MRRTCTALTAGLALAFLATAARADFDLPLCLREWQGTGGTKYVSNGVPLLAGQAMEADELHVLGPDGVEVPAQFRVLARWWRGDNSIRWVLVDFIGRVEDQGQAIYTLAGRKAKADRPRTAMTVTENDEVIRVNTGPALFEIDRKHFNLLNRVQVDADDDGQFAEGETLVHPDPLLGSVTEDPQGRKYYSGLGTRFVKVLEQGPVRVTVLAKGTHVSKEAGAFQPGLYGYEVFLTFHAGQPYVNVDAILTNNFEKPIGEPHVEDWSVLTRVGADDAGGWGMDVWTSGYAHAGGGGDTKSVVLYQDSVGTTHWRECAGFEPRGAGLAGLSSFRGYRFSSLAADGKATVADAGDFARGCAQCGRSDRGAVIAPRYFWQQFPSAIEYGRGGLLRYSMFPREYSKVHWLEDGSAKGQEFQLFFYIKGARKQYTAMIDSGRPWPHVVMDTYESRPFALPSPEHCGAAGALADLGRYAVHPRVPLATDYDLPRKERRFLTTDYLKGNGYGWQVFGMRWEEMAGHSPWNYEPIWTSSSLFNYLLTRQPNWLEWGLRVSRHARDVRAYLIDDQDNLALWTARGSGGINRNSVFESYSRPKPQLEPHPYRRAVWPLPNHEHLNLDEVYDLYCLTGDDRARRCLAMIADHGAYSAAQMRRYSLPSRSEGWCLRTLMRYYDLTGEERVAPFVTAAVDKLWKEINKAGTQGGTWYGGIFGRGVVAAYLATGDERCRDVAIGQADWARTYEVGAEGYPYQTSKDPPPYLLKPEARGARCHWANSYLLDVHAFAYHETGNPEYLAAMEFAWEKLGPSYGGFLYFLPMALQRAYGERPDKVPPAAVADLKAAAEGGKVTLSWTAPGDDGTTGTARLYQLKYATKPILEFVPWPEKKDTHVAFWGAENVADEPAPAAAGTRQTYTFASLAPGTYHFAIKARDECSNQSAISNVVSIEVE